MSSRAPLPSATPWRLAFVAGAAVTLSLYLYFAFFTFGTTELAPLTIQDDARQFLAWMSRIGDPAALPGDLIADYWQGVSPPAYRMIYEGMARIGIGHVLFSKILPVPLFIFSVWMAWRIARRMSQRPLVAFTAAAFLIGYLIHDDSIWSATPRAFSAPLFLLFLDGLQRNRGLAIIGALAGLGLLYPATALVALTMLGLSRIGVRPWRIDFGVRTWLLCIIGAVAVAGAALAFEGGTERWGPTLTMAEALQLPNLSSPSGRSAIVGMDGRVDYLCSARMGLLPEIVPCWATPHAVWPNLLLLVPMMVLGFQALRRRLYQPGEQPGNLIHVWVIIAGLLWWTIAVVVAFKLHVPSRAPQRTIPILEFLAIGQVAGMALDRWIAQKKWLAAGAFGTFIGLFLTASFASPLPGFRQAADPGAVAAIAAMPPGTVIAGASEELSAIPALTGRPVLATIEHAIPWHRGYYVPFEERLRASLAAVSTSDPAVLADFVQRWSVRVIAVDRALLDQGTLPPAYATIVPAEAQAASAALSQRASVLQQRAGTCTIHDGLLVLIDASCLATGNRAPI